MDAYFPKTRRPTVGISKSLKRPAPATTPPKAAKIPATPTTPKDARLKRPAIPPPLRTKGELQLEHLKQLKEAQQSGTPNSKRRPISVRELFKTVHKPQRLFHDSDDDNNNDDDIQSETTTTITTTTNSSSITAPIKSLSISSPIKPSSSPTKPIHASSPTKSLIKKFPIISEPISPNKISSGPLKGVSTSLLDHIRAKEAAANATTPEQLRTQELLGIAPEVVRIVPTVFTANKKEVMPFDKVVDKCFKGLRSNYTTETIIECLKLMDKIAPEWTTTVNISRGTFLRINRDKYTIPQLLEAIRRFKKKS